ncbi:trypsin-like [Dendropsophus ebraccatus]|uniref:trypsin-like n=1 Tax=Dendropsophus ebraccatus TaxID=150705 RepID=UPI0038322A7A
MSLLLVAALLGTLVDGRSYNRIIGGFECKPNSQPWQVSLHYFDQHACGGILIDETWVLTAAHCQLPSLQIRLGDHNIAEYEGTEQFSYADRMCPHPGFDPVTYDNDIMLLKLPSPVTLNENVQIIPLGCPLPPDGTKCSASGWGSTTSPDETYPSALRCVSVELIPDDTCRGAYPGEITENMLCAGVLAGGKDTCQGDSGGPLVCNSQLSGITSWGNIPCGVANRPGVYTRICNYLNWIRNTIANGDCLQQ